MKRLLYIIMLTLISLPILSQQTFKVYDATSKVTYCKQNTDQWVSCKKKVVLSGYDKIKIPKRNSIKILDSSTNRIYSNVSTGTFTVNQIVKDAKNKSNAVFHNLNQELERSIKGVDKGTRYSTYGATSRGDDTKVTFIDSLYSTVYHAITDNNHSAIKEVKADKHSFGDVSFYLTITNSSNKPYFIQLISYDGKSASFCYDVRVEEIGSLPIASNASIDLSPYVLSKPESQQYFLLVTDFAFNTSALSGLLSLFEKPRLDIILDGVYTTRLSE